MKIYYKGKHVADADSEALGARFAQSFIFPNQKNEGTVYTVYFKYTNIVPGESVSIEPESADFYYIKKRITDDYGFKPVYSKRYKVSLKDLEFLTTKKDLWN